MLLLLHSLWFDKVEVALRLGYVQTRVERSSFVDFLGDVLPPDRDRQRSRILPSDCHDVTFGAREEAEGGLAQLLVQVSCLRDTVQVAQVCLACAVVVQFDSRALQTAYHGWVRSASPVLPKLQLL